MRKQNQTKEIKLEISPKELYDNFIDENGEAMVEADMEEERDAFGLYCYLGGIQTQKAKQKEFLKELKEEFKSALCRIGFTDNQNQNRVIRMEAHDTFLDVLDEIATKHFGDDL